MGFLDEIGSGLRSGLLAGAAGMSNEVFREQGQAIARRKEHDQNRQAKAAEIMLQAAHSGQIPDDKLPALQQSLARMGYDLPIEALSPSPEARQKLSEYARKKSDLEKADAAGTELANYGQPDSAPGLGIPGANTGLRGGAPAPLPQVPMPPRPQGMPPDQSANPPGVQTFPLAPPDPQKGTPSPEQPFSQAQQDQIADTEALSDSPDYPPDMIPTGPPVARRPGEIGQLAPVEVVGRRPQAQPSGGTIPPIVQNEATPAAIAQAIPPGTSKPDLMQWYKKAMIASQRGVPGAKDVLDHVLKLMNPGKSDLITVGEGQTLFDPRTGKAVFHGAPKTSALSDVGKLMQERAAMVAADPNNPMIAKYDEVIGEASAKKSAASSDLGKLIRERDVLAASDPNSPMLAKYDETIKNYKQAANVKDDTFKNANVLRDEFNTHSKTFASMANARRQIIEAARDPTAAGDLSLLYGYMKSLDPNSVVRESEFAMAAQAGSLPDRIQGWATKLINGERLPDKIRKDFVNQSAKLYDAAVVDQEKLTNRYRGIAQRHNIPEIDVVGDFGTESKMGAPTATLTVKPSAAKGRGSMGTAAGFAPPKGAPAGTKFHGYSPDGQRVWKLPDGSMATE